MTDQNPAQEPNAPANLIQTAQNRGTITNSSLGTMGRYGNQLFQYMFLKTYAAANDLRVECPPWIGNYLFATDDPPMSRTLPMMEDVGDRLIPGCDQVFRDCDFRGYFQYHTSYYAPQRDYIRSLFQPSPAVRELVETGWRRIAEHGQTIVALHLRRDDFGQGCMYITPTNWYLRWLEQVWPTFKNPILFVASDEPSKVLRDFRAYRPTTARDMGVELPKAPYYLDFYALTQCDVLAIPNSTFSFVAAMLNLRLQLSVRSVLPLQSFVKFDPWNDHPLDRRYAVEDFKGIRGATKTRFEHYARLLKRLRQKLAGIYRR